MKTIYLTLMSYDSDVELPNYDPEYFHICSVSTDKNEEYERFKEELVTFLSQGPDDVSTLSLLELSVDDEIVDRLIDTVMVKELEHDESIDYVEKKLRNSEYEVLDNVYGGCFDEILDTYQDISNISDRELEDLKDEFEEDGLDERYEKICKIYVDCIMSL